MAIQPGLVPTPDQLKYLEDLRQKLHLAEPLLDGWCVKAFGRPFRELDRAQVSGLLDCMIEWKEIPRSIQRLAGQTDLPGLEP